MTSDQSVGDDGACVTGPADPAPHERRTAGRRRPVLVGVVSAAAAGALVVGAVLALDGPGASGPGGGTAGGAASCVEEYSPRAVAGRAFALDGTVRVIGDSATFPFERRVSFEVHRWYAGGGALTAGPSGGAAEVLVDVPAPGEGGSSDGGLSYAVGDRLLVSGEVREDPALPQGPVAWGCGFSLPYDSSEATAWQDAIAARTP